MYGRSGNHCARKMFGVKGSDESDKMITNGDLDKHPPRRAQPREKLNKRRCSNHSSVAITAAHKQEHIPQYAISRVAPRTGSLSDRMPAGIQCCGLDGNPNPAAK